jgi:hypothetical protein
VRVVFGTTYMERVVPHFQQPDYCAFGEHAVIVFGEADPPVTLIPIVIQQLARFFNGCPPNLRHLFVAALV